MKSYDFNVLKSLASYGTELIADDAVMGGKVMRTAHPKRNIDPVKFHAGNGQRIRFGIYPETSGKHLKEAELPRRKFPKDEKYHLYKIETVDLEQSTLVWAGEWLLQHSLDNLCYSACSCPGVFCVGSCRITFQGREVFRSPELPGREPFLPAKCGNEIFRILHPAGFRAF